MPPRDVPMVAGGLGTAALATCVGAAWYAGVPAVLLPVILPALWWAAGMLALAARPDHGSARLLTAAGLLHLVAFAVSAAVSVVGPGPGWPAWAAATAANICFSLGFVAIATLLVTFPAKRIRSYAVVAVLGGYGLGAAVVASVTSSMVDLPLHLRVGQVSAPSPLPVGDHPVNGMAAMPLVVVVGLAVLVWRTWWTTGSTRRQLLWPTTVAGVLVLLLAATPAGEHLLGPGWALVFVPIVGALPFALLSGLVRFRLLEVELYAARTLAYAAVAALVVIGFGAVGALAGSHGGVAAALVAALAAAVGGNPLRVRLESWIDRLASGGRLRGHALLRHLSESIDSSDASAIAQRSAGTIASGLEVAWVAIECPTGVSVHVGGPRAGRPEVCLPLVAGDTSVGMLTCGPRRGGWADDDIALVRLVGRHVALALRGAELTRALARRVAELTASRERLVRAEEDVRRRIERDLHDGIQQQLVVLLAKLGMLRALVNPASAESVLVDQAHTQAQRSLTDLRELALGIHPSVLTDRGLVAAVEAQTDLLPIPVVVDADLSVRTKRFADEIEAAAYYVVCEATTNVLKHSGAERAWVAIADVGGGELQVVVGDDGRGFVSADDGTGLRGLADRVEVVGGSLSVTTGNGTTVTARFPVRELAGG